MGSNKIRGDVHIDKELDYLPHGLRFLEWNVSPLSLSSKCLPPQQLVVLKMSSFIVENVFKQEFQYKNLKSISLKTVNAENCNYLDPQSPINLWEQFGEILGILLEAATSYSLLEFESEIGSNIVLDDSESESESESDSEIESDIVLDDSKSESQIQSSSFEFKSQFDFYLPYLLLPGNEIPKCSEDWHNKLTVFSLPTIFFTAEAVKGHPGVSYHF
nr:hypothetical protein CFP56_15544 [Quercus suber]